MKPTVGERIFYACNTVFLIAVALLCIAPMVHILAVSFSANDMVTSGQVTFWPKQFTLIAYEYILENKLFWRGMWNSFVRIVIGVSLNLLLVVLAAYPLSKEKHHFRFRTVYAWIFFITMIFGGGLIPWYMVIKELNLLNTIWALVLPGAVPIFLVLIMLNFFRGLPAELEEAALIDGCGHWRMLFQIFVPLSKPALATIAVHAILGQWNSWFDGLILMNEPNKYPLITYLQTAVVNIDYDNLTDAEIQRFALLGERSNKAAQIFLGSLPVILCYPFLQKYFTKGLVLGSVKG
jgi:putative aldouronate transport system permease protein